jgi:hypothetical protein
MPNSKHTPRPWNYDGHGINHEGERIFKTCLNYDYGSTDRDRAIADSILVVAAPDLLEAAEEVETAIQGLKLDDALRAATNKLYAAIARATGGR